MPGSFPSRNARYRYLQQIVSGVSDGVILIETDETIIWANETALEMHGVRTLADLGTTVPDYCGRFELRYRNGHRTAGGHTPIERVMAGETFNEVVVDVARKGEKAARWTHRIRSLVLTDDDGRRDLLVLILDDETERYHAEERFERAFNANPAPALILRLRDLTHIRVNQGFLDMTGCREDQVVGRSIYEVDILEGAARRELAIERLQEGRTVPQMEATMQLPQGGERCVIVAGQPIDVGDTRCMLFTFADLEGRRQAEAELRRSEQRFELAFRMAPVPTAIMVWKGWHVLLANDAFARESGHATDELVGQDAHALPLWADPQSTAVLDRLLRKDGRVSNLALPLQTRGGDRLDCLVSAELVEIRDQSCVLLVAQNVADRQRSKLEVADAIAAVMHDTSWFTDAVLDKLARRSAGVTDEQTSSLAELPPRAREILDLVCEGLDDGTIAERLAVARNTVRNHVASLYRRTGVDSRAKLIIWARERGVMGAPVRPRPRPRR
ncbi:PAS domain S-box protein [Lichenicola cladoniae]|uniref:PAS domain S-box protein n=1 Tax=Lichenicola cladoniae TaxID=1484109 RepID=A0A6M8HS60_9PROT|nr:PAS domain S-box protein [Lichenicola cladoniae]NPD65633.1 PAS domain S-box protein [Acetobacteraceae bacterium]QKE91334.1 PAS domain S-box protein [Lichenicola cladoniae]